MRMLNTQSRCNFYLTKTSCYQGIQTWQVMGTIKKITQPQPTHTQIREFLSSACIQLIKQRTAQVT
jgi:hypothetical protein